MATLFQVYTQFHYSASSTVEDSVHLDGMKWGKNEMKFVFSIGGDLGKCK